MGVRQTPTGTPAAGSADLVSWRRIPLRTKKDPSSGNSKEVEEMEGVDMSLDPALIWFFIGVALALLEFVAPGVILVFFGVGAWIVAITTWAGLTATTPSQLLVFATSSALLIAVLRRWISGKFSGHVSGVQDPSVNLDEFTGKPVEVLEDVVPGSSAGKVEFKGASWSTRSDETIRRGEAAVIERLDGIALIIKKNLGEKS
jgi:membrane protein implicated in regulation of membrane protease activity